jgi:hypothetical protein
MLHDINLTVSEGGMSLSKLDLSSELAWKQAFS